MWTIWMWGGFLDLFRRIRWAFHSLYTLLIDISRFLRVWSWFWLQEQREPAIAIFVNAWVSILFAIEGRGCIGLTVSYQLLVLETKEVGPEAYLHCETWCFLGTPGHPPVPWFQHWRPYQVPIGVKNDWWSIWPSLVVRWPLSTTQLLEAPSAPKMSSPQQDGSENDVFSKSALNLVSECSLCITRWPCFSY